MSVPRLETYSARIVITGLGLRTALGNDRETTWGALKAGRIGARWLNANADPPHARFAGYPCPGEPKGVGEHVVEATREALADARLGNLDKIPRERIASVLGLSKGDLGSLGQIHAHQLKHGAEAGRFDWFATAGGAAAQVAALWDFRGPCIAPVAACATGLVAVLRAFDLLQRGECDLAIAGAGDASLEPLVLGAFRRMGVLARIGPDDDPRHQVRPLDCRRSGFLPGEGAAVLVLERLEHALARYAPIYAELRGGAMGSDARHITDIDPDPSTLARVIEFALQSSQITPDEIDHVNLHATATRTNDPVECRAVNRALGSASGRVLATANKAQIGHTLGAAGAVELAVTCLSLRDQVVPPSLNRSDPDPHCAVATSPVMVERPIRAALKLSLGFGGHLTAVVLKRFRP